MSDILLSALRAHAALIEGTSSNIANVNTQGYRPVRTTLTQGSGSDVVAVSSRSPAENGPAENVLGGSDVDLPAEICNLIRAQTGFEAVLSAIATREETIDDLLSTLADRTG